MWAFCIGLQDTNSERDRKYRNHRSIFLNVKSSALFQLTGWSALNQIELPEFWPSVYVIVLSRQRNYSHNELMHALHAKNQGLILCITLVHKSFWDKFLGTQLGLAPELHCIWASKQSIIKSKKIIKHKQIDLKILLRIWYC